MSDRMQRTDLGSARGLREAVEHLCATPQDDEFRMEAESDVFDAIARLEAGLVWIGLADSLEEATRRVDDVAARGW